MKRLILLQTAFIVLFLIFVIPSILSANSKNIWQDESCIKEIDGYGMSWQQQVSIVFVGEVVWAQPREEADNINCGIAVGSRYVRHKVIEVLMGRMELDSKLELRHQWCEFYEDKYTPGTKFVIGLNTHFNSNILDLGFKKEAVAWELPLNPENREKAKTFIQCIQDLGIGKEMLKENEN